MMAGCHGYITYSSHDYHMMAGCHGYNTYSSHDSHMQGFSPPVLVFVQSIERAKELFHELIYDGLNVEVMHSERTQAQRDNIIKCFRSGKVGILSLCTTTV